MAAKYLALTTLALAFAAPTATAAAIGQMVDIREDHGRIVIAPLTAPSFDLDTLLATMTPETFRESCDFGSQTGGEIW